MDTKIDLKFLTESQNLGKRKSKKINSSRGKFLKSVVFDNEFRKISFVPTILKSALNKAERGSLVIKKEDLMAKAFSKKRQTSILFVVDASGSMGVEELMDKTKGLVFDILRDAYIRRERVGFITFRGTRAEIVLPFTKSIAIAKDELKKIKTGGKTPLSMALKKALEMLEMESKKEKDSENILLIFSDARANVSMSGIDPFEEAIVYAKKIVEKNIKTFIIDTDPTWINYPYAKDLAKTIKAKYFKLSDILRGDIRDIIYS